VTRKLDESAYAYYLGLGPGRSHRLVALHYSCSKKAVTNKAIAEGWKEKIAEHERQQREETERKASESLEAMNERHLKMATYMARKGLEALSTMTFDTAMDATRAIKLAAEMERLIRGQPSARAAIDIEQKIRSEHQNWAPPDDDDEPEPGEQDSDGEGEAPAAATV
jgi:hypothetical protein